MISLGRPRPFGADDAQQSDEPSDSSLAGEHGVEWGEDLHALLEAAMRTPGADLEGLARSLSRVRENNNDDRVGALLTSVQSVQQSAIWKRASESPQTRRSSAGDDERRGRSSAAASNVRRGVIDLAFREPKGWVIVDYKTDQVTGKSLAKIVEHYRPQVQSYAHAWGTLVGQPVHEVGLFLPSANRYECWDGPGV